jgi:fibronectin type 3 domain-containing protein
VVSAYRIYRSLADTGTYTLVDSVPTDTFTDVNMPRGTRSFYEVSAVNKSGESQKTAFASALAIPGMPTSIVVDSALSGDSVMIAWIDTPGTAAYYKIYKSISDSIGSTYAVVDSLATDTFYDTALSPGIRYYYKVSAVDSSGESGQSIVVSDSIPSLQPAAKKKPLQKRAGY